MLRRDHGLDLFDDVRDLSKLRGIEVLCATQWPLSCLLRGLLCRLCAIGGLEKSHMLHVQKLVALLLLHELVVRFLLVVVVVLLVVRLHRKSVG